MTKKAIITGVNGQDGSYLAELLISKGYEVYGLTRAARSREEKNGVRIIECDIADEENIKKIIRDVLPDEVYNLASLSSGAGMFNDPVRIGLVNGMSVTYLLDAIKRFKPEAKFFQASSGELYDGLNFPQDENTPFNPRSPYGIAKLYAHLTVRNYREHFGLFSSAGILFNHESERRGVEFVTRKITSTVAKIARGEADCLELGNLSSKRDWGYAKDYADAMWLMLQAGKPGEFVISTGETHTVREFVELAFGYAGFDIGFEGEGADEVARDRKTGKVLVRVSLKFFRPAEIDTFLGNPEKARRVLNWTPAVKFNGLVKKMMEYDL